MMIIIMIIVIGTKIKMQTIVCVGVTDNRALTFLLKIVILTLSS